MPYYKIYVTNTRNQHILAMLFFTLTLVIYLSNTNSLGALPSLCTHNPQLKIDMVKKDKSSQVSAGLMGGVLVMETYASADGKWLIFLTHVNGKICLIATGDDYRVYDLKPAGVSS